MLKESEVKLRNIMFFTGNTQRPKTKTIPAWPASDWTPVDVTFLPGSAVTALVKNPSYLSNSEIKVGFKDI